MALDFVISATRNKAYHAEKEWRFWRWVIIFNGWVDSVSGITITISRQ